MGTPSELCRTLFGSVPIKSRLKRKKTSVVDGRTRKQVLVDTAKDLLCSILDDIHRPLKKQKSNNEEEIGDDYTQ